MTLRPHWLVPLAMFELAPAAQAKTRAEALFDSGRALMSAQRYAEACSKFSESQALEPAAGTLLNLADCQEHLELPADAMKTFEQAAQLAEAGGQTKRSAVARARAAKLIPLVATLELHAEEGTELAVDDAPVGQAEAAAGLAVNPGLHKILATARTGARWVSTVGPIAAGKRLVVTAPSATLAPAPATRAPAAANLTPAPAPAAVDPATAETTLPALAPRQPSALRQAAPFLVTGGGALAALGVIGIAHALSVSSAVAAQQPGGPNANAPTVTRADFQQLSWLYPASLGAAVAGASLAGLGIYGFASNQGGGAGVAGHF